MLAPVVRADDAKMACIKAAENAQLLRDEHKLIQARAEATRCAREECPDVIRKDCAEAVQEISRMQPSITVRATVGNRDRSDVSVTIDGVQVARRLDGTPIRLDPGVHVLRLESPGVAPSVQELIMIEGDRTRIVDVVLEPSSAAVVGPPRPAVEPPATAQRHIPPGAIVLGGVGLVGVAGFAYFGLSARSAISDLRTSCAPYCSDAQISDVQTKRIAADVSLGVGLVALGVATWLFLRGDDTPPAATTAATRRRF